MPALLRASELFGCPYPREPLFFEALFFEAPFLAAPFFAPLAAPLFFALADFDAPFFATAVFFEPLLAAADFLEPFNDRFADFADFFVDFRAVLPTAVRVPPPCFALRRSTISCARSST